MQGGEGAGPSKPHGGIESELGPVLAPTQDVDHLGNEACVVRGRHHLQEAFRV